jgi:hypothetical protein
MTNIYHKCKIGRRSKVKMQHVFVCVFCGIACNNGDANNLGSTNDRNIEEVSPIEANPSLVDNWTEYLQSSDSGLWEDSTEYSQNIAYLSDMYEENAITVYSPYAISCYSDTIYVTDASTRDIVALHEDGTVLWRTGGAGEGPGEFSLITTLAASKRYVAASNIHLGRIEIFYSDGSYANSIQIERPQDIAVLNDSTFIVGSTEEQGGDLHIVDVNTGIVKSFGEVNRDSYQNILRPDLIRLCVEPDGKVAVFNRYEGLLAIYDIDTEECVYRGNREYPAEVSPPVEFIDDNGDQRTIFFPIGGNIFLGSEGMLNVVVCNYMEDGSFLSDPEYLDFAPITAIDRYNWDGEYLDSYCLPDSCINYVAKLPSNKYVAINFAEGILCLFEERTL